MGDEDGAGHDAQTAVGGAPNSSCLIGGWSSQLLIGFALANRLADGCLTLSEGRLWLLLATWLVPRRNIRVVTVVRQTAGDSRG